MESESKVAVEVAKPKGEGTSSWPDGEIGEEKRGSELQWRISNTSDLHKFSDKIFQMYHESYKNIGIIDYGGWDKFADYLNCSCYLLEDSRGDIHGIILYWLHDYGNKISLVISETSTIAKKYVIPKLIELIQTPGFFVELSDALEYFVNFKHKIPNIKDKEILKLLVYGLKDEDIFTKNDRRLTEYPLNAKKEIPSNEGSYLRDIKGVGVHRKALYGIPCLDKSFKGDGCKRICNSAPKSGGKKSRKKKLKRKRKTRKKRRKNRKRGSRTRKKRRRKRKRSHYRK